MACTCNYCGTTATFCDECGRSYGFSDDTANGWRFDIEKAPKGSTKTVDGPKGPREVHVPETVFLACRDGQTVTLSRWLPKEGRWNMLASGEQPLAWRPYPKHPNAEAS